MKILILLIVALFVFPILANSQDCSSISDFDVYIEKHPEILVRDNPQLQKIGQCFINSNMFDQEGKKFQIPNSLLSQRPDLIFLILYSKEMENDEQKQSWFNIFPLMTEEHLDRLYNILLNDKKKQLGIELTVPIESASDGNSEITEANELKKFALQTKYSHYLELVNQKKYQIAIEEFNECLEYFPNWEVKKLTTLTYRINDFIIFEEFGVGNTDELKDFILDENINGISENSISAQFLYLEYALTFCKDKDIKELVLSVLEDYKDIITERKYFKDDWYFELTKNYYNSAYNYSGTFEEIERKAFQLAKSYHPDDIQRVQAYTLEYLCFYVLFQLKQTNPNYNTIADIFKKTKLIYEDINNPAYSFVEKGCMIVMENQFKGILPISVQEKMSNPVNNENYLDKDPKNVAAWSIWFWFKEKHPIVKILLIISCLVIYGLIWYVKNIYLTTGTIKNKPSNQCLEVWLQMTLSRL